VIAKSELFKMMEHPRRRCQRAAWIGL